MTNSILSLASIRASALELGQRTAPPKAKILKPEFWESYDADTLIYDCVWQPDQRRIRLFLPKLFNFDVLMKSAKFLVDGAAQKPRLRKFQRFDIIDLAVKARPAALRISYNDADVDVPINAVDTSRFAGRNVIYTMVKDGSLSWVRDWVQAHQLNHGADAVLIANNGSTAFSSKDLLATIASVKGINVAHVIDVPFRYAPAIGTMSPRGSASFLQTACLNIMRDRFFQHARAVLICDVDELVAEDTGQSIFDATVKSALKYKTFLGYWRFADPTITAQRHADHVASDLQNEICASKYCIVPDSFFGRMCWSVHCLENVNRRIFRPRNSFRFFHCRGISTSWKAQRNKPTDRAGPPDPAAQAFMKRTFG
jgi:hypothetical protein